MTETYAHRGLRTLNHLLSAAGAAVARAARPKTVGKPSRELAMPESGNVDDSIRRHVLVGAAAVALLAGGLGVWAVTSEVSGAVVASGHLVVESNVKAVQHLSGGVVGTLNVRDGDQVQAGDVLLRLDDTLTRANLAIVTKSLDELSARRARLTAERDGVDKIAVPEDLLIRASADHVAGAIAGEQNLFTLRRAARDGQIQQLGKRIAQLEEEIAGVGAQKDGKEREIALIEEELIGVRDLWEKKLIQRSRLLELERAAARLEGERGQLAAALAQAKGRISEMELAIIQIEQDMRSEVARELRETEGQTAELEERRVAAEELLRQVDIRAPQSGRVHELAVHTIGGVIGPGESVLRIVPSADDLTVEARVAPQDIDQVHPGQPAFLRLSAFNQQTTPELAGEVSSVSPDLIEDSRGGASYYNVRVSIAANEIDPVEEQSLKPGMPVEAFLRTSDRTVMSYLFKPLSDQINRAFRE